MHFRQRIKNVLYSKKRITKQIFSGSQQRFEVHKVHEVHFLHFS